MSDKKSSWESYWPWVMIAFVLAFVLIQPYFEMRAFNKFKSANKPKATYWDAMFSQLRIQDK